MCLFNNHQFLSPEISINKLVMIFIDLVLLESGKIYLATTMNS